MSHPLTIVDVFAESRWSGNQLGVIHEAADLSTEDMQAIARELGFSETTFLLSGEADPGGGWPVRIFTPGAAVPFAGHPTLGTAWVLAHEVRGGGFSDGAPVVLALTAGRIPVECDAEGVLWMTQLPPRFGPELDRAAVARALGLDPVDLDARHPVRVVSTGLPFAIAPVRDLAAVQRARADADALARAMPEADLPMILIFCAEAREAENDLHVRVFCPGAGVPEDPATGSANGCLAGYLVHHRVLGAETVDVRVEQGWEIHRPSLLRLRAARDGEGIRIRVGGRVRPVARGELL